MNDDTHSEDTSFRQLGVLLKPKNLLRTFGSVAPGASAFLEIQSQLEGAKFEDRLSSLELTDATVLQKLTQLEKVQPKPVLAAADWPLAVAQYLRRAADLVVFYDGVADKPPAPGIERFLAVAHGCFVDANKVLTCSEALSLAASVAEHKGGSVALLAGIARYELEVESFDELSGLVMLNIVGRDEDRYERSKSNILKAGLPASMIPEPLQTPISSSAQPWVGQEIGFLHSGEASDALREGLTRYQCDRSWISHLREPKDDTIKSFMTGVLAGRISKTGSPVFAGDGTLLGIMSESQRYPSDVGRRAVVKSLLGHPRFTVFSKTTQEKG